MSEKVFYPTKFSEVRVGDKISVFYAETLFANLEVKSKDSDSVSTLSYSFSSSWDCTYFLIERPKKPLPTKLGSVVKASGVEWVLCDPDNTDPWYAPKPQTWVGSEYFADGAWEEVV